jgi:hypothetical protein
MLVVVNQIDIMLQHIQFIQISSKEINMKLVRNLWRNLEILNLKVLNVIQIALVTMKILVVRIG